jgi:hypothetical protein
VVLDNDLDAKESDRDWLDSNKWEYNPSDEGHYVWCRVIESGGHGTIIDTSTPDGDFDPGDEPTIEDAREMWQSNCPL